MEQSIKNFFKQFEFQPEIVNTEKLKPFKKIIVAGMGGSHLAADILKAAKPELDIVIHNNYDLPLAVSKNCLVIASSYSGNTEETIDTFKTALRKKMNLAVVSVNGKLLELAKRNNIPYIRLLDEGIQPRLAIGFSLTALMKLAGLENDLRKIKKIILNSNGLSINEACRSGEKLAKFFKNKIPIVYSSLENEFLARIWKINFNETAKIPAFYNVFPELNHNEMEGFDVVSKTKQLSRNFGFLVLNDEKDDKRILKRMEIFRKIFIQNGFAVEFLKISGKSIWEKIFNNYLTAVWASYFLAKKYGNNPEEIPLVENFKKMI